MSNNLLFLLKIKQSISFDRNKSLFKLLLFVTLFAEPVTALHFIIDYTAIIDYVIMSILLIRAYDHRIPGKHLTTFAKLTLFSFFFVVLKSFTIDGAAEVFGQEIGVYIKYLFTLLYLFVCYTLFEERRLIINFAIWEKFIFWICICSIVTITLYRCGFQFLFYRHDILDYHCDQIPFIGIIHYDDNAKIRPSWLFYEPSLLGNTLGLHFMIFCRYYLKNKLWSRMFIYILAIVASVSMTAVGCTLAALVLNTLTTRFFFIKRHKMLTKILIMLTIPTLMTFFSVYDASNIMEKGQAIGGTSISTRQTRLVYGLEQVATASITQLLLGRGKSFNDLGMGVSNWYLEILCADGALILLTYLILVFYLLRETNYEYYYMLVSMNIINMSFTPFFVLMMIIAKNYYKYRRLDRTNFNIISHLCAHRFRMLVRTLNITT